jgi:dTDP-4-amino-4,6-dideoxygalactose transaminase
VATNFSTTEIQGLGLQLQIARNDQIMKARYDAAAYLTERLSGCDAIIPQDLGGDTVKPTFHLYKLLIDPEKAGGDIQVLKKKLAQKGVTEIAHFGPLYRFAILKEYGYDEDEIAKTCPVCEEVFYHRFTHFPVYGLTQEQLDYMADSILESVAEMQAEAGLK